MVIEMNTPKRISFHVDGRVKSSTPLRRNNILAVEEDNSTSNNDEEERIRRRTVAELRKSLPVNSSVSLTPTTPGTINIPIASLQEHFDTCLRLFTQNKINKNNVWNLHVIDYLKSLLTTNMDVTDLLQIAGVTVEIGAKIYSIQIDDVHAATVKLANALAQFRNAPTHEEAETEQPQEVDNEEQAQNNNKKKKKSKNLDSKTRLTIVDNEELLNAPIPKQAGLLNRVEESSCGLLNVRLNIKNCELLTNERSKKILWNDTECSGVNESCVVSSRILRAPPTSVICPTFTKFSIDQWNVDTDIANSSFDHQLEFDVNGRPLPVMDIENCDPNDMDTSAIEDMGSPGGGNNCHTPLFITDTRPTLEDIQSNQPFSEYSYKPLPQLYGRIWAGPAHWKWKYVRPPIRESAVAVGKGAQKSKKPRRIIKQIEFSKRLPESKLKRVIQLDVKKPVRTTRNTAKINDTLPENLDLPASIYMCLRTMPGVYIRPMRTQHEELTDLDKTYSYDNPDDNNYCNQTFVENEANVAEHGEGAEAEHLDVAGPSGSFDEHSQVSNTMGQNYVPYARKAKRMDMKKLKTYIWEEITEKTTEMNEERQVVNPSTLSTVYTNIPSRMSQAMEENLSCPLAFIALLHLANEQNLLLTSNADCTDVHISKPT